MPRERQFCHEQAYAPNQLDKYKDHLITRICQYSWSKHRKIIRIQQYSVYGMYKMRDIYLNISLVRIGSGSG